MPLPGLCLRRVSGGPEGATRDSPIRGVLGSSVLSLHVVTSTPFSAKQISAVNLLFFAVPSCVQDPRGAVLAYDAGWGGDVTWPHHRWCHQRLA